MSLTSLAKSASAEPADRSYVIVLEPCRLESVLAMLRMVGYSPKILHTETLDRDRTRVLAEMPGTGSVAQILVAWLRTIPGIESVLLS